MIDQTLPNKHMTLNDRFYIERCLSEGIPLYKIAKALGKDTTTISKEIKRHRITDGRYRIDSNDCIFYKKCKIQKLCLECNTMKRCATCKKHDCRKDCVKYASGACMTTERAPYVCNGCNDAFECVKPHYFYRANYAYDNYISTLTNSRKGVNCSPESLYEIDSLISPLLKQGQSLSQIYATHGEDIPISRRTLYTYLDNCLFTARNIDLPRKVKYKPRKKKRTSSNIDYSYKQGRSYKDFEKYIAENPETSIVEMDSVVGPQKTGKVMLTMFFRNCSLMLIFLMKADTQACVSEIFDMLTEKLGLELFQKLFPVILTDNGSEFKNPDALENTADGASRTKIFYCDPLASWQKGRIEKNHEYIRYIIPKGTPLTHYTQRDITKMMNHINGVPRLSLNNRSPYELASFLLDEALFKALRIKKVHSDKIILKPELLRN